MTGSPNASGLLSGAGAGSGSAGLLVLSDADIRAAVPPIRAVATQGEAYRAVTSGLVTRSGGTASLDPEDDSLVFALTGAVAGVTGVACKFGLQVPSNSVRGLPPVHAFVTLLDAVTGVPLACLNGTTITTMRTAAGIAAAADVLARPDADQLAVIGTGVQAAEAVRMIAAVRPIRQVRLAGRDPERAGRLAAELSTELGLGVTAVADPAAAADQADIVATCTTSRDPVVRADMLAPRALVLTVGSYAPDRREVALDVTELAQAVYVDDQAKAAAQCGPVIEAGLRSPGLPAPRELGELLLDPVTPLGWPARPRDDTPPRDGLMIFHSVGLGVQDATLAWAAYTEACSGGLGSRVSF